METLWLYSFFNLDATWGGWSTPSPPALPPEGDPVPIVQEAGLEPEPDWADAENLAPTGIRSPDRPVRSESLYRLSHAGPYFVNQV
jgi:hypothetical protein